MFLFSSLLVGDFDLMETTIAPFEAFRKMRPC